mgnify:CR=1 FL=1
MAAGKAEPLVEAVRVEAVYDSVARLLGCARDDTLINRLKLVDGVRLHRIRCNPGFNQFSQISFARSHLM